MRNQTVVIDYADANGEPSRRTVDIKQLDSDRFEAWCHAREALRTFRYDRLAAVSDAAGVPLDRDRWVELAAGVAIPHRPAVVRQQQREEPQLMVLLSGFKKADLAYLEALAEQHDIKVSRARQVTSGLDYLVVGDTPGASKVTKAESQGIPIMLRDQLLHFIETGELP